MNKILYIAFLILVTNLWSLLAVQAETTPLGKIMYLGIANETERAQFIKDMEGYTKADFALRKMIGPDSNKNREWQGIAINQMKPSFANLSLFSIKVTNLTKSTGPMREYRNDLAFYREVNQAFNRGMEAGEREGAAEVNTITNEIDFVSKANEYARILEQFEKGKFGDIIRAAEK